MNLSANMTGKPTRREERKPSNIVIDEFSMVLIWLNELPILPNAPKLCIKTFDTLSQISQIQMI